LQYFVENFKKSDIILMQFWLVVPNNSTNCCLALLSNLDCESGWILWM